MVNYTSYGEQGQNFISDILLSKLFSQNNRESLAMHSPDSELVDYLDEYEMQAAIACEPDLLEPILREHGLTNVAMMPREFPLPRPGMSGEQDHLDGLAVAGDGTVVLIECKLARNRELDSRTTAAPAVARQVCRYVERLRKLTPYRFNGELSHFLKGYGLEVQSYLSSLWGKEFKREAWLERIGAALLNGRIIIVIAVDEINNVQCNRLLAEAEKNKLCLEILRVSKRQAAESKLPVFESELVTRTTLVVRRLRAATARPVRTQLYETNRLSRMQPRVREVDPPSLLHVEVLWRYVRNALIEEHHAVDPARNASFIPVMPDLRLLRDEQKPYPDRDDASTIFPLPPDYRPWLQIGREVWRMLAVEKQVESERDAKKILQRAVNRSRLLAEHPKLEQFGSTAVSGALRDLSLFGVGSLSRLPSTSNRMNWRLVYNR